MVKFSKLFPAFLLCPLLYGMQNDTQNLNILSPSMRVRPAFIFSTTYLGINGRLEAAARIHNVSAYRQAADEAIAYAKDTPNNIGELLLDPNLDTLQSGLADYNLSIGYDIPTDNTTGTVQSNECIIERLRINLANILKDIQEKAQKKDADETPDSWSDSSDEDRLPPLQSQPQNPTSLPLPKN